MYFIKYILCLFVFNLLFCFEINPVSPTPNERINETNPLNLIMFSVYDPNDEIDKNNSILLIDGLNVSQKTIFNKDMVMYIPSEPFKSGLHVIELQVQIKNQELKKYKHVFTVDENKKKSKNNVLLANFKERFNIKGNLGWDTNLDESNTRPYDTHKLNSKLQFQIGKIKFKTSYLHNTHIVDTSAKLDMNRNQSPNRLKLSMQSKWLDLNYGDFSPEFSDFTLKGTRVKGFNSVLKLGWIKTMIVSGKTKELISDIITDTSYTKATPIRNLNGFRSEIDFFRILKFGTSGLISFDDKNSINYSTIDLVNQEQYALIGNIVFGTDVTLHLNQNKTVLSYENALSITNQTNASDSLLSDVLSEDIKDFFISPFEKVIGFNLTDDIVIGKADGRGVSMPLDLSMFDEGVFNPDTAISVLLSNYFQKGTYKVNFKTPINLPFALIQCNINYKRIPSNYFTFGSSSIQSDVQGYDGNAKVSFFKDQISFNFDYKDESDNVSGNTPEEKMKSTTTSIETISPGISLNIAKFPSLNYSFRQVNKLGLDIYDTTQVIINNNTVMHTIAPQYKFAINKTSFNVSSNIMLMQYLDNLFDPILLNQNPNFSNVALTGGLAINFNFPLSLNIGYGKSNNNPEESSVPQTIVSVFSSKLGYKFFNNMLATNLGISMVQATQLELLDNQKLSTKFSVQYKLNKNFLIAFNYDRVQVKDQLNRDNDQSLSRGKLNFKYNF